MFPYSVRTEIGESRMDIFDISLEIPNIKIETVQKNKAGDFVITVISTADGTICHRCGREITKFYGYGRETELRHLPILGHKTAGVKSQNFTDTGERQNCVIYRFWDIRRISVSVRNVMNVPIAMTSRRQVRHSHGTDGKVRTPGLTRIIFCFRRSAVRYRTSV